MTKNLILIILCTLICSHSFSQEKNKAPEKQYDYVGRFRNGYATVGKAGKYGYIYKGGEEIIPCIYDADISFHNGYAILKKARKEAIVDTAGNFIVPFIYDSIDHDYWQMNDQARRYFMVSLNHKWGMINKRGKQVIAPVYESIWMLPSGYVQVSTERGRYGIIDSNEKVITPFEFKDIGEWEFNEGLMPVAREWPKIGFIDTLGKEIVPGKYNKAKRFSEGLAAVRKKEKWGYIDVSGNEVIPCMYSEGDLFKHGLAAVKNDSNKWGYINRTGSAITPFKYDYTQAFTGAYAQVRSGGKRNDDTAGRGNMIDTTGREIFTNWYPDIEYIGIGLFAVENGKDKWGVINVYGQKITDSSYQKIYPFDKGMAVVRKGNRYGFIDSTGLEVVHCVFDSYPTMLSDSTIEIRTYGFSSQFDKTGKIIRPPARKGKYTDAKCFSEGLAAVTDEHGDLGFINKKGEEVIACHYDDAGYFSGGRCVVLYEGKWGMIDEAGTVITPFIYNNGFYFLDGLAMVEKNGKWGYLDSTGQEVIPCIYDYCYDFRQGLACVYKDNKTGIINKAGRVIVPLKYEEIGYFDKSSVLIRVDTVWAFLDSLGDTVFKLPAYKECNYLDEGLIKVTEDHTKWGIINIKGETITRYAYDEIYDFTNGIAVVSVEEQTPYGGTRKYGGINKKGEVVIPLKYNLVFPLFDGHGLNFAEQYGLTGLINIKGDTICPFVFDDVSNQMAEWPMGVKRDGKWGYIDRKGKMVIPCRYDSAGIFYKGLAAVFINNKWAYIDKTGKVVLQLK